ncbi:MAG: hypothetical protein M1610_03875 [Nitrospirae bacterium]|nr:hypothetical protein [Nitrospirota bacterium]MCL5062774.1 hypothetical protein [Nitrospirota bacterium]MDA8214511.1 hypothetical protein [Nitrospiraceae bacterium]MDA8340134.1 hypothetical protein [Nitrospiraceae bacterium]
MENFLKSYGTLILAVYGIIQVWIIALWKKYARKGKINIYETGNIEIGYSAFGPTIGINGTLRALNKDLFIKAIDLLVIREKDKAQHIFKWIAFRPPKIDLAGSQPVSMEIPSGFLVSPDSPHRFNVVFNDNDLFEDIRPLFNEYVSEWYKVADQLTKIWSPLPGAIHQLNLPESYFRLIEDFRKSKIRLDMYTALDRKCYWESGDYSLTMNVRTSKPDKVFINSYKFSITEADSKNLKLNAITILEEPISSYLRVQNYPYNFAYSTYK